MKKMYLMKGMAALAMGLVAASCNKMDFDQNAYQQAKEQESKEKFINNVMNGQDIDPNQTWATTVTNKVTVNSELSGTLRIYTANPHGTKAAALYTQEIQAGNYEFTVTKPQDAETLYAKLTLNDGTIRVSELTDNVVTFKAPAAATLAARRVVKHDIEFPDAPAATDFATSVPDNCLTPDKYYDNRLTVNNYVLFDQTTEQEPNFYMGNFNLYVTGTKVLKWTNPGDGSDDMAFYVLPGANLTFTGNCFDKNGAERFKMYIAQGATVTFEAGTNSCIYMYNRGTVIVKGSNASGIYGNGVIYNEGTMKFQGTGEEDKIVDRASWGDVWGKISSSLGVWNGAGRFVNAGTLEAKGLRVEGSGKFLNLGGNVTISGYTLVNSNDAVWINDGTYTTTNYTYTAGSENVWNNCKLTVTNKFLINLGQNATSSFKMESGSSAIVYDFVMDANSRVIMGGNSIIKVSHETIMNNTAQSFEDAGIIGPQSGELYAVLQSPKIEKGSDNNSKYVCYNGNVYIATDSHFAQKDEETANPMYRIKGNASIANGQTAAPYTIPANGNCSDGYNGGGGGGDETPEYYYYAFEDLGAIGDFDFNDVVLRVSAPVDGKSTVDLCAAGGKLQSKVLYENQVLCNEVHAEFEVELTGDDTDMVNTGFTERTFKSLGTVIVGSNPDMANLPLAIEVTGTDGRSTKVTRSVEGEGKAPLMIVVSGYPEGDNAGKWFWATERTNITTAYPEFGAWGANVEENEEWYLNYTVGKVWKY